MSIRPHCSQRKRASTYTYDANGNVTKAGGWSYLWDYLNRMLASGYNNSTTTYAYDQSGARVLQTSTTSTAYYPSKFFSLASTTNGGTSWATSTNYIWLGDTLLATIDQKLYNGAATGTAITRYVHPDHLGSTNVVTDASGTITQLFDYYPYGATRVSSTTYPTNEKRQYINQFMDAQTGLDYLNARYYDAARGQFLSQDQVFWEVGLSRDGVTALVNPQAMNSYAYAGGNPIIYKDSNGRFIQVIAAVCLAAIAAPYALMLYGAIAHSMDSVALGADLLGPAQGISAGAVEITGGSNPITGRSFESIAASTQAKENTSSSVYVGVDKCNAIKYVGRTNQDPEARWAQHKSTINSGRDALDYYTFGPPGSYTEKQSTLLEQSLIVKYGMQKNGGQLINRINSVSPSSPMYQFVKNYDGLWTGLPQTVTQNGTTYYRNSSGLLSNKPGQ
jgi:RHS repeat-associated protein